MMTAILFFMGREYERTITLNDSDISWDVIDEEAKKLNLTRASFTLMCYRLYFNKKTLKVFLWGLFYAIMIVMQFFVILLLITWRS